MFPLVVPLIDKALDLIFPDKTEKDKAKAKLAELALKGELQGVQNDFELLQGQIRIAEKSAESGDIFVSGARPFILWVCGGAFAWNYIVRDLVLMLATLSGSPIDPELIPRGDMSEIMPVMIGMLGLSTMRSYEKRHGVARSKL